MSAEIGATDRARIAGRGRRFGPVSASTARSEYSAA